MASSASRSWKSVLRDNARLLDLAVRIAAFAFLFDDIIEFRAFIRDLRIFLPSPVLPVLSYLPAWTDWVFFDLHMGALAFLLWRPRLRAAAITVLAITALRVLGDLIHLQPFVMMYSFTILMAALPGMSAQIRLQALRLMVVGVYFWGGFHKLNSAFYLQVFPWFISPFWARPPDHPVINALLFFASFTVPVFEALIGIFLLFQRTRRLATAMASVMLIVVMACLGPYGHNIAIIVWPWNVYLFATESALFLVPHTNCLRAVRGSWLAFAAMAIFILAPALGIWGLWPSTPSFKLYSGNVEKTIIILDAREKKEHLPGEIVAAMDFDIRSLERQKTQKYTAGYSTASIPPNTFGLTEWLGGINIAPYPSEYVSATGSPGLCGWLQYPGTAVLRVMIPDQFESTHMARREKPLCPVKAK